MSTVDNTRDMTDQHTDPSRLQDTQFTLAEFWRRYGSWFVTIINLTTFFLLWELFARCGAISPLFLPKASDMFNPLSVGSDDVGARPGRWCRAASATISATRSPTCRSVWSSPA